LTKDGPPGRGIVLLRPSTEPPLPGTHQEEGEGEGEKRPGPRRRPTDPLNLPNQDGGITNLVPVPPIWGRWGREGRRPFPAKEGNRVSRPRKIQKEVCRSWPSVNQRACPRGRWQGRKGRGKKRRVLEGQAVPGLKLCPLPCIIFGSCGAEPGRKKDSKEKGRSSTIPLCRLTQAPPRPSSREKGKEKKSAGKAGHFAAAPRPVQDAGTLQAEPESATRGKGKKKKKKSPVSAGPCSAPNRVSPPGVTPVNDTKKKRMTATRARAPGGTSLVLSAAGIALLESRFIRKKGKGRGKNDFAEPWPRGSRHCQSPWRSLTSVFHVRPAWPGDGHRRRGKRGKKARKPGSPWGGDDYLPFLASHVFSDRRG